MARRIRCVSATDPRRLVLTGLLVWSPGGLRAFNRILESEQVRLDIIGLGGDPKAVVQRAVSESKKVRGDPNSRDDTFWAFQSGAVSAAHRLL